MLWPLVLPGLLCLVWQAHVHAQKPVYRCDNAGQVRYSDEPCVGAREIDATPTQGMDKMTGTSRKGADVRRDEHNAAMANALRPLTGMDADQYRVYRHRLKLSPADQAECARLDRSLPALKARASMAPAAGKAMADVELYKARKLFNDLNC